MLAPGTTIRWGILSTAEIGTKQVIPAIQSADNCEVVALASRNADHARVVADELGIDRSYGSYESVLEDPEVDAVYIPLPNHLHGEWTLRASDAGKHVLCEKPVAMTAAEAQVMVDACEAAGVKFMEAFMYRLHPSWVHVCELVGAGRIGDVRAVQSFFSYFNDDPANIRNQLDLGGGALMDVGCYNVNLSRMLFGAEPSSIQATVRRDPNFGTDVVTSAVLEFPCGGQATFTCATQLESHQQVQIVGTDGRIDLEIPFNIPPDRETKVFVTSGGSPPVAPDTQSVAFAPANHYAIQAGLFADAILTDGPVPTEPSDAVANMAVIEAILASAE